MNPHPDWINPAWPHAVAASGVRSLITTRAGGASTGPMATLNLCANAREPAATTAKNLARLRRCLPAAPVWLKQVHGIGVLDVEAWRAACGGGNAPVADASVTTSPQTVLALQTADCLPVLLADAGSGVLGAAHAGWRGLAAGVLEATVATMVAKGAVVGDIHAHLGPAISQAAFEVGDEVREAFVAQHACSAHAFAPHATAPGKWFADLYRLARQRLTQAGVTHIAGGDFCTYRDGAKFYSYRREAVTGRMASCLWRVE